MFLDNFFEGCWDAACLSFGAERRWLARSRGPFRLLVQKVVGGKEVGAGERAVWKSTKPAAARAELKKNLNEVGIMKPLPSRFELGK